jgi:RNA polymerase subunit RPABC4/transcription elongation factor Spt4
MRPLERGSAEERRTHMAKGCLYCGLQLPETADFCPQCGRPIEDAIRVESGVKMRRTHMAKGCLYCGLQLPESAEFCPQCGRPLERGFGIRPIQESEFDGLSKEMKGKDDLPRQKEFYSDCSGPRAHMEEYAHPGNYPKRGARLARHDRKTTASVEKIESIAEENVGEYSLT